MRIHTSRQLHTCLVMLLLSGSWSLIVDDFRSKSSTTTICSRRHWILQQVLVAPLVVATTPASAATLIESDQLSKDPSAGRFFFPTLTPPFTERATVRYTLGRDAWAFEQLLTFANVTATIRSNVIRLKKTDGGDGGLWVHSPQWPTGELCSLLAELPGQVEHIVLPCNALEHKAPMAAFVKKYPNAKVWISPGQYGPFGSCGRSLQDDKIAMGYHVDGILGSDVPPWADEFDIATLYVDIPRNAGPVSEVAFCHRPTRTLVATDAVIFVPVKAPDIFKTYFDEATVDDPTFWPRTVLQAVFLPLRTDENGRYPGYDALQNRLVRAPILRAFADARAPTEVSEWIKEISTFDFDRIITSHFSSPIATTPLEFAQAFAYLPNVGGDMDKLPPIECRDWDLLDGLNQVISDYNLGAPTVYDYSKGCK